MRLIAALLFLNIGLHQATSLAVPHPDSYEDNYYFDNSDEVHAPRTESVTSNSANNHLDNVESETLPPKPVEGNFTKVTSKESSKDDAPIVSLELTDMPRDGLDAPAGGFSDWQPDSDEVPRRHILAEPLLVANTIDSDSESQEELPAAELQTAAVLQPTDLEVMPHPVKDSGEHEEGTDSDALYSGESFRLTRLIPHPDEGSEEWFDYEHPAAIPTKDEVTQASATDDRFYSGSYEYGEWYDESVEDPITIGTQDKGRVDTTTEKIVPAFDMSKDMMFKPESEHVDEDDTEVFVQEESAAVIPALVLVKVDDDEEVVGSVDGDEADDSMFSNDGMVTFAQQHNILMLGVIISMFLLTIFFFSMAIRKLYLISYELKAGTYQKMQEDSESLCSQAS